MAEAALVAGRVSGGAHHYRILGLPLFRETTTLRRRAVRLYWQRRSTVRNNFMTSVNQLRHGHDWQRDPYYGGGQINVRSGELLYSSEASVEV